MNQKNNIKQITIADAIRNGGATLNADGVAVVYSNGYQVSKKDCYKLSVSNIDAITKAVSKLLNQIKKGEFVGLWCDGGFCYIDISERIHNQKRALRVGRARKQISILRWADMQCINC